MVVGLDRSWNRDAPTQPPSSPTLLYTIAGLEEQLKAAYKLVTEGKFSDALRAFLRMLQVIPLMAVESRKEVDEVISLVCFLLEGVLYCRWQTTWVIALAGICAVDEVYDGLCPDACRNYTRDGMRGVIHS